jgi:hypothetical protein
MTLREKTNAIAAQLNKADLDGKLKSVADIGEVPYQANLRALKAIDIKSNRKVGEAEVKLMLSGLDYLIDELELFRDASKRIGNQATAVVRQT